VSAGATLHAQVIAEAQRREPERVRLHRRLLEMALACGT